MRLAWLIGLFLLVVFALFIVLGGGGEQFSVPPESRALAGTVLGVALSAIVTNVNSLLTERAARDAIKVTTLRDHLDLAMNMAAFDMLLRRLTTEDLTDEMREALASIVQEASSQAGAIAARLAGR